MPFASLGRTAPPTAADDPVDERGRLVELVSLAGRLDARADGSGHAMRRSLCLSLPLWCDRVQAARALVDSAATRPAKERLDLHALVEHLLIVGFAGDAPITSADRRDIHALLRSSA